MSESKSFDLSSFKSANMERSVSCFDYLYVICKDLELPADFIFCFAKLFWPEVKIVDGYAFLSEEFDAEYYHRILDSGQSHAEAQVWINTLEITGLFGNLSFDQACTIAASIAESWNIKLKSVIGEYPARAKAIFDNDECEVFVTIESDGLVHKSTGSSSI